MKWLGGGRDDAGVKEESLEGGRVRLSGGFGIGDRRGGGGESSRVDSGAVSWYGAKFIEFDLIFGFYYYWEFGMLRLGMLGIQRLKVVTVHGSTEPKD